MRTATLFVAFAVAAFCFVAAMFGTSASATPGGPRPLATVVDVHVDLERPGVIVPCVGLSNAAFMSATRARLGLSVTIFLSYASNDQQVTVSVTRDVADLRFVERTEPGRVEVTTNIDDTPAMDEDTLVTASISLSLRDDDGETIHTFPSVTTILVPIFDNKLGPQQ